MCEEVLYRIQFLILAPSHVESLFSRAVHAIVRSNMLCLDPGGRHWNEV